ncbi:hypothetical protein Scep_017118 [Stephania cephalantha]|uniref:Uncharacterized protein n=1 Tax=Stephania cephalantha TaxID=152367 RepID=A0AAP0IPW1_9MAGN
MSMVEDSLRLILGVCKVQLKWFDERIKLLRDVQHMSSCIQNIISLSKGYRYSERSGILKIFQNSSLVMKGVRKKNFILVQKHGARFEPQKMIRSGFQLLV